VRQRALSGCGATVASALVTDRSGGASLPPYDGLNLGDHVGDLPAAVQQNRDRLTARVGRPVIFMNQVHGVAVAVVDASSPRASPAVDALVTTSSEIAIAVLVADCVPVLLADAQAGVVGAVHAGRRGVQAGVVAAAWAEMRGQGARAERTRARLGPAVCGSCYEVPPQMQADVAAVAAAARTTTKKGTTGLDLRAAVVEQLAGLGVHRVEVDAWCTAETPAYYSHRRDGVTGRFAGVVWLDRP
jgi:YfiH family protein